MPTLGDVADLLSCLVQQSDMPEEMRAEVMELCVTACEKYSANNEVRQHLCNILAVLAVASTCKDDNFPFSCHLFLGKCFVNNKHLFQMSHQLCKIVRCSLK